MTDWRPIETAPHVEDVLGFFPDAAEWAQVMICHFLPPQGPGDEGYWYEQNVDRRPDPLEVEPSYWMPLPEPPNAKASLPGEAAAA